MLILDDIQSTSLTGAFIFLAISGEKLIFCPIGLFSQAIPGIHTFGIPEEAVVIGTTGFGINDIF